MQHCTLKRDVKSDLGCIDVAVITLVYLWAAILYSHMIMIPISGVTYRLSAIALLAIFEVMAIINVVTLYPLYPGRHIYHAAVHIFGIIDAAGIYTALAYRVYMPGLVKAAAVIFAVLVILFAALIVWTVCALYMQSNAGVRFRMKEHMCRRTIVIFLAFGALAASVMLVPVLYKYFTGQPMYLPDVKAEAELEEFSLKDHVEEIAVIGTDEWITLSTKEKLNVLQTIANIEKVYTGIDHELNVGSHPLKKDTNIAYYDNTKNKIIINQNVLDSEADGYKMLNAICHEAFHAYSWQLVDVYEKLDDEDKRLLCFQQANQYRKEFADYKDAESYGYKAYSKQYVESDARTYAEKAVEEYRGYIEEYLKGDSKS